MSDLIAKVTAGAVEGGVKATAALLIDLVEALQARSTSEINTLAGWIIVARRAVKCIGRQAQDIVVLARDCNLEDAASRQKLEDALNAHIMQDNFRPSLLDAVENIPICIEAIRNRTEKEDWWPFWRPRGADNSAWEGIDSSLREYQAFLTGLSQSGTIDAISGFPFVMEIERAFKRRDKEALERAVNDALSDKFYTEWLQINARSVRNAQILLLQMKVDKKLQETN